MDRTQRAVATGEGAIALSGALEGAGWSLAGIAASAGAALALLRDRQPDLMLLDAVLPGMDGVALARRIRGMALNVQPAILLLRPRGLRLPGEDGLIDFGATALATPAGAGELAQALEAARALPIPLPPDKAARLEALMDALGIPDHPGRACLRRAVALAWADRRLVGAPERWRHNELRDDGRAEDEHGARQLRFLLGLPLPACWRDDRCRGGRHRL